MLACKSMYWHDICRESYISNFPDKFFIHFTSDPNIASGNVRIFRYIPESDFAGFAGFC